MKSSLFFFQIPSEKDCKKRRRLQVIGRLNPDAPKEVWIYWIKSTKRYAPGKSISNSVSRDYVLFSLIFKHKDTISQQIHGLYLILGLVLNVVPAAAYCAALFNTLLECVGTLMYAVIYVIKKVTSFKQKSFRVFKKSHYNKKPTIKNILVF